MIKKILLDTDIGPDCDDVAALAMLNLYADRGLCEILGVVHCTSNPYGAGTIDAVNRYYGRPDIPVATWPGEGFLSDETAQRYNRHITTTLPNRYRDTQPEDAVPFYRRTLAAQTDNGVEIVAIGPLNNLAALLASPPDQFSPLDGCELVKRKVTRLVLMAGFFAEDVDNLPAHVAESIIGDVHKFYEFNIVCDVPAARAVAEKWPTPMIYLGFEAGIVQTGKPLQTGVPENHPVRMAYDLYTEDGDRYSWDLLTVEFAVDPQCGHYACSAPGRVTVDENGATAWREDAQTDHRYILLDQPLETIAADINQLLLTPPRGGFPA